MFSLSACVCGNMRACVCMTYVHAQRHSPTCLQWASSLHWHAFDLILC